MRHLGDTLDPADQEVPAQDPRVAERRALKQLAAVYRAADQLLEPFTCDLSGACCQLSRTWREPYLFPIELVRLLGGLAALGRALPPARSDGACRLLDASGVRCSIYEHRPFGCRTYFCERGRGPRSMPTAELHHLTSRLTRLSDERDPGACPRQLTDLLLELDSELGQ